MNIEPIPEQLLNDEFTLLVPGESGYARTDVSSVRIERKSALSDYADGDVRGLSALTIFYDMTYSLPQRLEFAAGMSAEYDGALWEITEARLYCADEPHHYTLTARRVSG